MKRLFTFCLLSLSALNLFSQMMTTETAPVYTAVDEYRHSIDFSGRWQFCLDPDTVVMPDQDFTDFVVLPGTTDTNKKGTPIAKKEETTHLSRLFSYFGRAWYKKEVDIPQSWKDKDVILYLERTKPSVLYVDGKKIASNNDISTAQEYQLSRVLTPGRHTIALMIDNGYSVPKQLLSSSHAYTEDTQTNWNGIIGKIFLQAVNTVKITDVQIFPDAAKKKVNLKVYIDGVRSSSEKLKITAIPRNFNWKESSTIITLPPTTRVVRQAPVEISLALDDNAQLWSEFHPNLYTLLVEIEGKDRVERTFGLRDWTADKSHFYINGNMTYLRGKHDACVFPLTGHVAMDSVSWRSYFTTLKEYGINHVRFHSWCPPEVCFDIADEMGFYLQPELPFWGDFDAKDSYLMSFLHKEGVNIIRKYGHHPSFVMMALGNELWGSVEKMHDFIDDFREIDSTKLYTFGSNYYLGYQGVKEGMDYFTTCRVKDHEAHTRGSFSFADADDGGYINHTYPNSSGTFDKAVALSSVPVISHETGQFQTYPDFDEMAKYTGVLYPYNMEVFKSRLEKAGMLSQAKDFHKSSGLWSVQLYKADVEMDLRTKNMAGFQLLDIQDYPGQGSAYVGILDAFMDSKGITTAKQWRQFCSPVVVLFATERFTYMNNESLRGEIKIANYTESPLNGTTLTWKLTSSDGTVVKRGSFQVSPDSVGLFSVGKISLPLSQITSPQKLNFELSLSGVKEKNIRGIFEQPTNIYPLWVYPIEKSKKEMVSLKKNIIITDTITSDIVKKLNGGAKVLWFPSENQINGNCVGPLFQTDYWNYRMFKTISENNKKPVSPGTLGILTDPSHPIFRLFPTEIHTNCQWFPIIKGSHPVILDSIGISPVVQVIDNIERNHRLGLILEVNVGKGKMVICMSNLLRQQEYKESRQLLKSILSYMQSPSFKPSVTITFEELIRKISSENKGTVINELRNISYD